MKLDRSYPKAIISAKAAKLLKSGHVWVYADEVLSLEDGSQQLTNGCIVDVFEQNGTWQGAGLISLNSTIRIRLISRNANDRFDENFWHRRLTYAWELRKQAMFTRGIDPIHPDTDSCRLVFSEADQIPGLTVDRFGDILVAQVTTVGIDLIKDLLFRQLIEILRADGQNIRALYERADVSVRQKEVLDLYKSWWQADGLIDVPESSITRVYENGLAFDVDIEKSQKTGFFLDQKYNRLAVRQLAHGKRVLDCFSHVGPFGLNAAAGGAAFVRSVDISPVAIELARHNAQLNNLQDSIEFSCANVMEYLPQLKKDRKFAASEGGPFDFIILDPPAFTKSRSQVQHAKKGYFDINYEAMRLLPRGGYLATCSCSHFMKRDLLAATIAEAAHKANVQLKQIEERQQAPDHPIVWGIDETHYLDFFIFQLI